MKKLLFAAPFCVLILVSCSRCSREEAEPAPATTVPSTTELSANWKWIKTQGGIAQITETPASTGKNVELRLGADNQYTIYTNGVVTSQGTYKLETRPSLLSKTDRQFIDFSNDCDMMVDRMDDTTLELAMDVYDGTGSVYSRIQTQ